MSASDAAAAGSRPSSAPSAGARRQQAAPLTLDGMREHLQGVFIGFRPGDPTVGELPAQVPSPATQPADDSTPQVVRLRDWSMQQLLAEAAITLAADPFADLLPQPPGVPPDRIAYITGQEPARKKPAPPSRPASGAAAAKPAAPTAAAPLTVAQVAAAVAVASGGAAGPSGSGAAASAEASAGPAGQPAAAEGMPSSGRKAGAAAAPGPQHAAAGVQQQSGPPLDVETLQAALAVAKGGVAPAKT